jgi:hypothetical protein
VAGGGEGMIIIAVYGTAQVSSAAGRLNKRPIVGEQLSTLETKSFDIFLSYIFLLA